MSTLLITTRLIAWRKTPLQTIDHLFFLRADALTLRQPGRILPKTMLSYSDHRGTGAPTHRRNDETDPKGAGRACAAAAFTALTVVLGLTPPASAASLTQVTDFGEQPGRRADVRLRARHRHPANPAILLALHGCGGSGPGFYSGSEFASLADRYGFIVIYPSAEQQAGFGKCWDTWSAAAKVRGGGSDPVSLVSMITYAEQDYHGDPAGSTSPARRRAA